MKVGDAVKWVGYPGATNPGKEDIGIIIEVLFKKTYESQPRFMVLWSDGRIGSLLYEETIMVISEND
jgi:hypothetical protein